MSSPSEIAKSWLDDMTATCLPLMYQGGAVLVRVIDGHPVWETIPPEEFYLSASDILKGDSNA